MIKQEHFIHNEKIYIKTYSDEGFLIQNINNGKIYSEAVDILTNNFTYIETDQLIEEETDTLIEQEQEK